MKSNYICNRKLDHSFCHFMNKGKRWDRKLHHVQDSNLSLPLILQLLLSLRYNGTCGFKHYNSISAPLKLMFLFYHVVFLSQLLVLLADATMIET